MSLCHNGKNVFWLALQSYAVGSLVNHYFAALIKTLIDSIAESLPWVSPWVVPYYMFSTAWHPLFNAETWKPDFQRPQSSDLSRAHVSHHVRLHVVDTHVSTVQEKVEVVLCVFMHGELWPHGICPGKGLTLHLSKHSSFKQTETR